MPVLGVLNLPMMGVHASCVIRNVVTKLVSELAQYLTSTMFVIVPPSQPILGSGKISKQERYQKVMAHQVQWKLEFEGCSGVTLLQASALFDHGTMYSEDRGPGIKLWLLLPLMTAAAVISPAVLSLAAFGGRQSWFDATRSLHLCSAYQGVRC